jgi:hypothetical protein
MGDKMQPPEQPATTQKSGKSVEIPVPKRRDLMDAFRKIAQPVKKP